MLRQAGTTVALILALALTTQSALAEAHVHLEQEHFDTCLLCTAYSPEDAVPSQPATRFDQADQITLAAFSPVQSANPTFSPIARAPPVIR